MKLFIDCHVFDDSYQGTTTYIKGLYNALAKLRPDWEFYFGAKDIEKVSNEFKELNNVRYIKYRSSGKFRLLLEIPRILHKHKFDFAHFQYVVPPFYKNCKYIVTIHDILFNDFPEEFSFMYRIIRNLSFYYSAKKADILATVSSYSQEKINKHYKVSKTNIHVIPNAVDSIFAQTFNKKESQNYIKDKYSITNFLLYVSRIEPRKNQELLLQAYLDLKLWQQNVSLVFIGSNTLKNSKFSEMIRNLSNEAKECIFHLKNIPFSDLVEFYRSAELFVYPSKAEGFGIPPIEAASIGIPVICSNTTAMSDFTFLEKGFFSPSDLGQLKQKITLSLENKLYSLKELEDIKGYVANKYSWDKSACKLAELIEENCK